VQIFIFCPPAVQGSQLTAKPVMYFNKIGFGTSEIRLMENAAQSTNFWPNQKSMVRCLLIGKNSLPIMIYLAHTNNHCKYF